MGYAREQRRRVDDSQMDSIRHGMRLLTERLDDDQVLELSDMLHDILRRRRGGRSFAPYLDRRV